MRNETDQQTVFVSSGKRNNFPKWRPINYSFVCMLISLLSLVNVYKKQKKFEVKIRQRGLINMQTKD